jgi:hypothetical protein
MRSKGRPGRRRFSRPASTPPDAAQRLVDFADQNDCQVRRIDVECLAEEGAQSCIPAPPTAGAGEEMVLYLSVHPRLPLSFDASSKITGMPCVTPRVQLSREDAIDAQVDNGEYGAGNVVVHRYSAISLREALGTAPPQVKHIFLLASRRPPRACRTALALLPATCGRRGSETLLASESLAASTSNCLTAEDRPTENGPGRGLAPLNASCLS